MLLEEIIQRVQSMYSKGVHSKDTRLTSRHIYSAACTARSVLLSQQSDKNQLISQWSYQPLCIELVKVSTVPIIGMKLSPGCTILRSKHKIPKIISNKDKLMIDSISTMEGGTSIFSTSFTNRKYASGNKFTSNSPRKYFHDNYLYITISKELRGIILVAAFDDPIDAYLYPSLCESNTCCKDIYKMEFPIDGSLVRGLVTLAANELILLMKQMTEDRSDNASDDTGSSGEMIHQPQEQG